MRRFVVVTVVALCATFFVSGTALASGSGVAGPYPSLEICEKRRQDTQRKGARVGPCYRGVVAFYFKWWTLPGS